MLGVTCRVLSLTADALLPQGESAARRDHGGARWPRQSQASDPATFLSQQSSSPTSSRCGLCTIVGDTERLQTPTEAVVITAHVDDAKLVVRDEDRGSPVGRQHPAIPQEQDREAQHTQSGVVLA